MYTSDFMQCRGAYQEQHIIIIPRLRHGNTAPFSAFKFVLTAPPSLSPLLHSTKEFQYPILMTLPSHSPLFSSSPLTSAALGKESPGVKAQMAQLMPGCRRAQAPAGLYANSYQQRTQTCQGGTAHARLQNGPSPCRSLCK